MSKSYDSYASFKTELNKLRSNIKSGQLPRIIVVWGPSEYLLNKTCKIAKNSWLRQTNSPAVVHESSNLIKDGLDVVFEQAGLFTASSLHIVRRAEKIKSLENKLSNLQFSSNNIIFWIEASRRPNKLFKALSSYRPQEITCSSPKPRELHLFLKDLCQERKLNIEQKAYQLILQAVGEDLYELENTIEKLSLEFAFSEKHEISVDQIASSIGVLREDHAFKLVDHILNRRLSNAYILIDDLICRGIEPLAILGILARHLRNAIKLLEPGNDGVNLPPFVKRQYASYLKIKKFDDLKQAMIFCQKIDLQLKSNKKLSPTIQLNSLLTIL